jgi:hypothetical protein
MPDMKLDASDAAELAEMLQFLSQWLARDPGRLSAPWKSSPATAPTAPPSCVRIWSVLSSLLGRSDGGNSPGGHDLRHECLSTWLNGGVYPTQVAEWRGTA